MGEWVDGWMETCCTYKDLVCCRLPRVKQAALQVSRAEVGAARAEVDKARRAAAETNEKASRLTTEMQEQM